MKATALAHPNIAFIKYWGKLDQELNLPLNNSISMNLDSFYTKTTVEFNDFYEDYVMINKKISSGIEKSRVVEHLDRFRKLAGVDMKAKVISENNFPSSAGIASSSSGFAALTLACSSALKLNLDERTLSSISRRASGSSCRSIPGGFVEWFMGSSDETSYAESIEEPENFIVLDIVAIVSRRKKDVSSTEGMKIFNPYFYARLAEVHEHLCFVRNAIKEKNFTQLGKYAEKDCISMHTVMMNSGLFYWEPETIKIIKLVSELRKEGTECYFTIDAGPNVHILTLPENEEKIRNRIQKENEKIELITSKPGGKARIIDENLF